jgi:DNA (cytosine-5)-methyltransferase 1
MAANRPTRNEGSQDPVAIDLFAGAGGLSCGFGQAGFRIALAVEFDVNTAATYRANHQGTDLLRADIRELNPKTCLKRAQLRRGELTALIGGPPCQGFSESNRRTRTLDNPRNYFYKEFFRFVDVMTPRWLVLENVAGLRTLADGILLADIIDRGTDAGYRVSVLELDASEYGVPQVRRRIFIVGSRDGLVVEPPQRTHGPGLLPFVTVRDAIGDLPLLRAGATIDWLPYPKRTRLTRYQYQMRSTSESVQGNLVTKNSALVLSRYSWIRPGQNWEAIPLELMGNYRDRSRCHTGIYHRLREDRPSKVIGNFRKNMLIHPRQERGLSIREAARIQSFPDDYRFLGSIGFQQQQVADAVPPLLAQAVSGIILGSTNRRTAEVDHGETRSACGATLG